VAAASTEPTTANPDELLRRIEEVWRSRLEFLISGLKVIAGSSTKTGSRKHQLRKYREYKKSLAEWMAELTTGQLAGVQIAATSILSHRHILAVFEVQADSLAAAAGVIKTATRARGPYTRLPGRGYVWFASRKRAVSERANDPVDAPLLLSDAIRAARNDDSFLDDFLKEAIGKPATVRNLGMLARVLAQPGAGTDAKLQEIARDGDPIGALVRQIAILSSPGGAVRLKAIKGRAEKLRNLVPVLGQRRISNGSSAAGGSTRLQRNSTFARRFLRTRHGAVSLMIRPFASVRTLVCGVGNLIVTATFWSMTVYRGRA
jgi:hypothetical protein